MNIKTKVWCHKEENQFAPKGYIYCWYYKVYNADTGKVFASDNTGNSRVIFDAATEDATAIKRCASLGILKKSRGW